MTTPVDDRDIRSSRRLDFPRQRVFEAFSDPVQLAQWWGPNGFRNSFEVFELKPGGEWRFVMHGPDGTDYKNQSVFIEIAEPERIVFDHVSKPLFNMTLSFAEEDGQTRFTMHMRFGTAEECARIRPLAVPANEQNIDRLDAVLSRAAQPTATAL